MRGETQLIRMEPSAARNIPWLRPAVSTQSAMERRLIGAGRRGQRTAGPVARSFAAPRRAPVARQFPGHCHSMPSRGLHEIEFFSDLVSNAIAIIGQVKEIARHGLDQCRCRTHVPKSASRPRKAPRPAGGAETGRDLPRPAGRPVMAKTILAKRGGR
jgi:hypothetical protein